MEREQSNFKATDSSASSPPGPRISPCGSQGPHRDVLRSSSKSGSTAAASLEALLPWHSWGSGTGHHWASRLLFSSLLVLTALPLGIGLACMSGRGPEEERWAASQRTSKLWSYQKGCELPTQGVGFLLGSPCHSINTSTRGQGKKYFCPWGQNEKTFLSALPLLQPPASLCLKKEKKEKKFYVQREREEGERVLFSFTIKKSQQDVLQSYKYTFQTVNISISSRMPVA